MTRKYVFLMSLLLLISTLEVAFKFQAAKAATVIYIRADGSINPHTAPILSLDNITYTLTADINASIVVQRSNIIIEGTNHTILGDGSGLGFNLNAVNNVTIKNTKVQKFTYGIYLAKSYKCSIIGNNVTINSYDGIALVNCSGASVSDNYVASNSNDGIKLLNASSNNIISGNTMRRNIGDGIEIDGGSNNAVSGCNVTANSGLGSNIINASSVTLRRNYLINNLWGASVSSCENSSVIDNDIVSNHWYGVYLEYSSGIRVDNNSMTGNYYGVRALFCSNGHIYRNEITASTEDGVWLDHSPNNIVVENNITASGNIGVYLRYGRVNTIQRNNIAANYEGISTSSSSSNIICENNITKNYNGVDLIYNSLYAMIYHNNFIDNTQQASSTSANIWNENYEGNYWSDYVGIDTDNDGIGNSPRVIDANNKDNFPLMGMFHVFNALNGTLVDVISNSSTSDFQVFGSLVNVTIRMHVSNMTSAQTYGFCRVRIPHLLMKGPFNVTVNGAPSSFANYTVLDNGTYRWIYFSYQHSTLEIVIQGLEGTPPHIQIISPESKTYPSKDIPLTFTVDEPTSWISYSLDGQTNTTITGNTTMNGLSDGTHRVTVFANDTAGNMGLSNTVNFAVDTTPPMILIITPENRTYGSHQVSLVFTTNETASWMGYSVDGNANVTISGNTTIGGLANNPHTIKVYVNDTVGNMGASSTVYFSVFTPIPSIYILSPQNMTYTSTDIPLTFSIDKPVNYMSYSLDDRANITMAGNTTLTGLLEGRHRIVVYANSTDGHMGASDTVHFTVDISPPDIGVISQSPPTNDVLPTDTVKVNATVTDNLSGVKNVVLNYTTNNVTWVAANMTKLQGSIWNGTIPAFPLGTNITYVIKAEDNVNHNITTKDLGYTYRYAVVPEFSMLMAVPLFMMFSLLAALAIKRKRRPDSETPG